MATAFPDDEIEVTSKDFYENPDEYDFSDCKYSLLIVGPSGAGKSTFCNFLVKEKRFKEAAGMLAGTEEATYCKFKYFEENILVVDCPGFCDPKRPHEEILNEICKAAILCRGGVDAIGIVMNPMDRFGENEKVSYDQIELFGGNFWKHSFLLFSHEKKITKKMGVNDAREYIENIQKDSRCPQQLPKLLNKVDNRYICVESSKRFNEKEYWDKTCASLYAMILQIRESNENEEKYSNIFTIHGRIAYDELLCIKQDMNVLIESMRDQMIEQENRINVMEGQRRSESCDHTDRLDFLTSDYERRIHLYQSEISELKSKKDKRPCCVM